MLSGDGSPTHDPRQTVFRTSTSLSLNDIRGELIRQEETIIFALIERAQFRQNKAIYCVGKDGLLPPFKTAGIEGRAASSGGIDSTSFMGSFLLKTELLHAEMGRYTSPDENAFFTEALPTPVLPRQTYPGVLSPNNININKQIATVYLSSILPTMCDEGSDAQFGSSATCDIAVLQALSKRIHYGKFVAEAKFQADEPLFTQLIEANDAAGLMRALTKPVVEAKVVQRVLDKASRYGLDLDGTAPCPSTSASNYKVDPATIAALYRDYLIPLNKDVQVAYLLQRLDRPSFAYVDAAPAATTTAAGPGSDTAAVSSHLRAAQQHFGEGARGFACRSAADVVLAVRSNKVAFGALPLEDPATRGMVRASQHAIYDSPLAVCEAFRAKPDAGAEAGASRYFVLCNPANDLGERGGGDEHPSPGTTAAAVLRSRTRAVIFFGVRHAPGSLSAALDAIGELSMVCLESIALRGGRGAAGAGTHGGDNEAVFWCELERSAKDGVGGGSSQKSTWEASVGHAIDALDASNATTFVRFAGGVCCA